MKNIWINDILINFDYFIILDADVDSRYVNKLLSEHLNKNDYRIIEVSNCINDRDMNYNKVWETFAWDIDYSRKVFESIELSKDLTRQLLKTVGLNELNKFENKTIVVFKNQEDMLLFKLSNFYGLIR